MRFRGLVVNRKTLRYMTGREFRRSCDGCGRRWHFKGMRCPFVNEVYCDGRCCKRVSPTDA